MMEIIEEALKARERSYCPYSNYAVGAALLTKSSKIFIGCNVENASYGACNCAERTAIFKAVSEGYTEFSAIAIAGGIKGQDPTDYAYPCGICRQVMSEFADKDFTVYVVKSKDDYKTFKLSELLPASFEKDSLK